MRIRTALICFFLQSVISFAAPVIVLPDNPAKLVFPPGETQAYAADFLNKILAEAIGQKLEIVPEEKSLLKNMLLRCVVKTVDGRIHTAKPAVSRC